MWHVNTSYLTDLALSSLSLSLSLSAQCLLLTASFDRLDVLLYEGFDVFGWDRVNSRTPQHASYILSVIGNLYKFDGMSKTYIICSNILAEMLLSVSRGFI